MATTGYGNWHSKKEWYSECTKCHKKGLKRKSHTDNEGLVTICNECRFCKYYEELEEYYNDESCDEVFDLGSF